MSFLWERYIRDGKVSREFAQDAGVLPSLRSGTGVEPGSAPGMWRYYSKLDDSGRPSVHLWAEHVCLTVFGIHQQGERNRSVHQPKVGFGAALRVLRDSSSYSTAALDAHVERLATATQQEEIAKHLTTLVRLMRSARVTTGFDYTGLYWDLVSLQNELKAGTVRRRWGAQYFTYTAKQDNSTAKVN